MIGLRLRWATPLALAAGLLLVLAVPPVGVRLLAVPAVAGLAVATHGQRSRVGFLLGLLSGLALFLPLLEWMRVVGVHAWLVTAALESLFVGALGAGLAVASRLRLWPLWCAAVWVADEAVRGRVPFGGFTWGRLAFTQDAGPLTPWVAVGGAPLLTFVVALLGTLLAAVVLSVADSRALFTRRRLAVAGGYAVLAVVLAPAAYALPAAPPADREVVVAAVQGNVPRAGLDAFSQTRQVLRNHADVTTRLAADVRAGTVPAPDLVIWPENATDIDPRTDPETILQISRAASAVSRPILVGAVLDRPDGRLENAGLVWDPRSGPGAIYVKRHLVPYGEYVPLRSLLSGFVSQLDRIPRDFVPADAPGVLDVNGVRLGDVICFEIAYDDLVRDVVTGGGQLLVVQTNNATYGRTGQPHQQFAISRLRAVEHGRAVVVASTSGISGIVLPDGHVVAKTGEFVAAALVERVPLVRGRTLATRVGVWPEVALTAVGLGAILLGARRRRRERGR